MKQRQFCDTLLYLAVLGLCLCRMSSAEAVTCQPIRAEVVGNIRACAESPVGFCAPSAIATGLLKGTQVFTFAAPATGLVPFESSPTLVYAGPSVFHTDQGELHLSVLGVLDQISSTFTETQRVTAGTGRFAGATGTLFIAGHTTGDDPNGALPFASSITGEICLESTESQ